MKAKIVPRDIFATGSAKQLLRASLLPEFDLSVAKLNAARTLAKVDVGLFGNSRIVSVSSEKLGLDQISVFNFAVPGTSMRHSVALLEALARENNLPKLALISMDNFALQYYGLTYFLGWPGRWRIAFDDMRWSLGNAPGDVELLAHTVLDHVYSEWR